MKYIFQLLCFAFLFGIYLAGEDLYMLLPVDPPQPPQCPPFEMYQMCLRNCSNCEQRGYCPIRSCDKSGCDCIPHFARLSAGGPCVPIAKCPIPECGENEIYRECGPICEKCGTLNCRVLHCEHKCYCKTGFKRDVVGKCIPEEDCPPRAHCPRFEEVKDSGLPDEYCLHATTEEISDVLQNKTKCYCIEGHKRNAMGHCLNETFCPVIKCLGMEEYHPCHRNCNVTCWSYGDPNCVEDDQCYPGCFCPEGYVMNDFRICVKPEHCPPGSNAFAPTLPPVVETIIPSSVVTGNNTPEDFTTTPANVISTHSVTVTPANVKSTHSVTVTPANVIRSTSVTVIDEITEEITASEEEEPEDLPDEDISFFDETTETTKSVVLTTPNPKTTPSPKTTPTPKRRPPKRTASSKSQARAQKTLQSTEAKTNIKIEEDEEFNENF